MPPSPRCSWRPQTPGVIAGGCPSLASWGRPPSPAVWLGPRWGPGDCARRAAASRTVNRVPSSVVASRPAPSAAPPSPTTSQSPCAACPPTPYSSWPARPMAAPAQPRRPLLSRTSKHTCTPDRTFAYHSPHARRCLLASWSPRPRAGRARHASVRRATGLRACEATYPRQTEPARPDGCLRHSAPAETHTTASQSLCPAACPRTIAATCVCGRFVRSQPHTPWGGELQTFRRPKENIKETLLLRKCAYGEASPSACAENFELRTSSTSDFYE